MCILHNRSCGCIFVMLVMMTLSRLVSGRALLEDPAQGHARNQRIMNPLEKLVRFRFPDAEIQRRPDLSIEYYYHYDFSTEYDVPDLPNGMTLEEVYAHAEAELKEIQARQILYLKKNGIPVPPSLLKQFHQKVRYPS